MANPIDNARARAASIAAPTFGWPPPPPSGRKKSCGGQRKPLKRLVSAKRIQGNPSPVPLIVLLRLGWILLDLAKFGSGLDVTES
jgi:hypothetical protein